MSLNLDWLTARLNPKAKEASEGHAPSVQTRLRQAFGILTGQLQAAETSSSEAVLAMSSHISAVNQHCNALQEELTLAATKSRSLARDAAIQMDRQQRALQALADHDRAHHRPAGAGAIARAFDHGHQRDRAPDQLAGAQCRH
jgi:hypothetical protein